MKRCFLLFIAFLSFLPAQAYQTDRLQVSLLTVEPRNIQLYTVYGHTALRLYDPSQQIDMVLNWGTFDFDAPHFLYRFIRGETDYFLSYSTYEQFLYVYQWGNATVIEQILDLPPEGKDVLLEKLSINLQPENRVYRYNFLFDNCTTRVRDLIEQSSSGLVYPDQTEKTTFRKWIHSCTESYPWMTFGIDLLIGSGADSLISARQELFLPVRLKEAFDESRLLDLKPLVVSSVQVLTAVPEPDPRREIGESPFMVGCLIVLIYIISAMIGRKKNRPFKAWFAPLFLLAGAAGCLLAFMAAFSYHPCVSPNWNLLWLHPLHLLALADWIRHDQNTVCGGWQIQPVLTRTLFGYHAVNFVLLCGLLLGWRWIPQTLNPATIPFILCLLLASGYWIWINRKHLRS
ncbi:MAG: DUF4105 domain-containing protein [Dysgonamonadaceae bacterium]|jgi:hypothetical protein|nr:DUF4105 domain-containing protein [Dysgonamonadaceae bacterium]